MAPKKSEYEVTTGLCDRHDQEIRFCQAKDFQFETCGDPKCPFEQRGGCKWWGKKETV